MLNGADCEAMIESDRPVQPDQRVTSAKRAGVPLYADWFLLSTIAVVLGADQLTKYVVKSNLRLGESWPSDGLFRLTHGTNTGAIFGLFPSQTAILIVASFVAIGFLFYFYRTHAMPRPLLRLAIGLQLGGALGNLTDRLAAGAVVDFIGLGWWPLFNLADSSIVVGMALLFGILVFGNLGIRTTDDHASGDLEDPDSVSR